MTSTYDHRIIQGAESGQFLQTVEAYLQGEHELLRAGLRATSAPPLGAAPQPPAPAAAAADRARHRAGAATAGPPDEELLQAVQAATSLIKAHRTHGHLAARLDPLGSEPEGDPALDPEPLGLTPELMARDPGEDPARRRPRRDARRRAPAPARDLLRHDRLRDRAHRRHRQRVWLRKAIESGEYRQPLTTEEKKALLGPPDAGRLARALHAQGLPGPEAVLDRGPRHDGPDARRADPARVPQGRARGRHRHGPPRPAQRARPQPRPRLRDDLPRVRGRLGHRGRDDDPAGRHRRRQVPPRRPGHLPGRRRLAARAPGVQPVAPRVRRPRRHRRHARGADRRARARTRTSTTPRRCRSSCTATPPSPARASCRRR